MAPLSLPPRILVLDDSRDWLEFLERTMERADYEARVEESTEGVLARLDEFPADVLIVEMDLAEVDGYDLVARVRERDGLEDLPILLVMPHGSTPDVDNLALEGPCDFITKPFRRSEFVTRIRALLRVKRLQDNLARSARRIQSELDLARTVQRNLLPLPLPERRGIRVAARYLPCLALGGDFFDVVDLGRGATGFFLADVVGHGASSALFTSFLKAQLLHWSIQMQKEKPGETLGDMNEALSKTFAGSGRFVTALYATFEPGIERINYANAGHPPPVRIPVDGDPVFLDGAEIPLGIRVTTRYSTRECPFRPGDRLYFYTDGILEQRGRNGTGIFGKERLLEVLTAHRHASLEVNLEALLSAFRQWIGDREQKDDINLLAFEALSLVGGRT